MEYSKSQNKASLKAENMILQLGTISESRFDQVREYILHKTKKCFLASANYLGNKPDAIANETESQKAKRMKNKKKSKQ